MADIRPEQLEVVPAPHRHSMSPCRSWGHHLTPGYSCRYYSVAEELLRALPGVTTKNLKYVMSRIGSVKELCGLNLKSVQDILGTEPGKACWEFMHHGE